MSCTLKIRYLRFRRVKPLSINCLFFNDMCAVFRRYLDANSKPWRYKGGIGWAYERKTWLSQEKQDIIDKLGLFFLAMGPKQPLIANGCCSLSADVSCLLRPRGVAQTWDTGLVVYLVRLAFKIGEGVVLHNDETRSYFHVSIHWCSLVTKPSRTPGVTPDVCVVQLLLSVLLFFVFRSVLYSKV